MLAYGAHKRITSNGSRESLIALTYTRTLLLNNGTRKLILLEELKLKISSLLRQEVSLRRYMRTNVDISYGRENSPLNFT